MKEAGEIPTVIGSVLGDGESITSQANAPGILSMLIKRDLQYREAVEVRRATKGPPRVPARDVNDLLENSTFQDALSGKITQVKAAKLLGMHVIALNRYVQKAREALKNTGEIKKVGLGWDNVSPGPSLTSKLPIISEVRASFWSEASDPYELGDPEGIEGYLWSPVRCSTSAYVLRVNGDSMTAPHGNRHTYPDKSYVFVDPEKRSPVNGARIIARLRGTDKVTFKVFKEEGGMRWLMHLNPLYPPIFDEFVPIGTVVGVWNPE